MTKRPEKHETWLTVAHVIAGQGTCKRRRVGCVLLDDKGVILSTGWNGPAPGEPHCIETPCPGVGFESGQGLSKCEAIHAEANALLTCPDIWRIHTVYCTTAPCVDCTKLLLRTSAESIYFMDDYSESGRYLWVRAGRHWVQKHSAVLAALRTMASGTMPDGHFWEAWLRFNDRGKPWDAVR